MRSFAIATLVCLSCGSPVVAPDGGAAGGAAGGRSTGGGAAAGGSAGGLVGGGVAGGGSSGGGSSGGGSSGGGSAGGRPTGGGAGGGAANVCAPLESAYLVAVESAKRCPLNALVNPCTATRPNVVTCGCATYIDPNNAAPVDAVQAQFTDAGCVAMACPRCAPLDAGFCEPSDAGVVGEGRCVDRR